MLPRSIKINIEFFAYNVPLQETLRRMRDILYQAKPELSDEFRGYVLDYNDVDYVYVNGLEIVDFDNLRKDEIYKTVRPAIALHNESELKLYNIASMGVRGGNTHHRVLAPYNPPAWVFCDIGGYNKVTNRFQFTPYTDLVAQNVEDQLAARRRKYLFSLRVNGRDVDYTIRPTDNPELFIQERVSDKSIRRDVVRFSNLEAREMKIIQEVKALAPKYSSERAVLEVLLESPIDINKFDELYQLKAYTSIDYGRLVAQRDLFTSNFGNLTRLDAYRIMEKVGSLGDTVIISF
jgi:hypothetical protein